MNRLLLPLAVLLASVATSIGELVYYYPDLPDVVMSHFDGHGQPDGTCSKGELAGATVFTLLLTSAVFLGSPLLMKWMPASLVNLPRKDYWFAPERKHLAITLITSRMLWLGAATMLFLAQLFHGVLMVNLHPGQKLEMMGPVVVYLVFVVAWLVEFYWRFAWKLPEDRAS